MKAKLLYLHSPDIYNLEKFTPSNPDKFSFLLQIMVGVEEEEGEESFDTLVCTPKWILDNYNHSDIIFGYHNIIVLKYDYRMLKEKIESYINSITASSWEEIVQKVSLIGQWEFDNYTY